MLKIGHRGAAGHAPENTIKSFEKAMEFGADAIEFDVRANAYNKIFVFHDATLKRMTEGQFTGKLCELSSGDIALVKMRGHEIPKLEEVLQRFGKRAILNIELKEEDIAGRVLELIQEYGLKESVIVSAFDDSDNQPGASANWADLLWLKRKEPKIKIALLADKQKNVARACSVALAYDVYAIAINKNLALRQGPFLTSPANETKIFVWTVNEVEEMKKLKEAGVDGIFSDYPDLFKEAGI